MRSTLFPVIIFIITLVSSLSCNESEVTGSYRNNRSFASTAQASADAAVGGSNLESAALAILQANCVKCHGAGASSGGFSIIDDVPAMIDSNKYIISGDPAGSAIYKRIAVAKNMPPSGPLAAADADIIGRWIEGLNLESAALAILQANCVKCHGAGASSGGFGIIDDVPAMIASNKYIIPGNPDGSALYKRMAVAKNMPPAGPLPSTDADTIKQWITGLK